MSDRAALYSVAWACVSSWYYGYHLSELNFPVESLTCLPSAFPPPSRLPLCLSLTSKRYSLVTALFSVGGLVGSLGSAIVVRREGLRGGIVLTGWMNLVGSVGMALAPHWVILGIGRFITGVASGVAVCLVPPFLNKLCRTDPQLSARSGQIGSLHQMGIVLGLFSAQIAGYIFTGEKGDTPGNWRYVVSLSGLVAIFQILFTRLTIPHQSTKTVVDHPAPQPDPEIATETEQESSPLLSPAPSETLPSEPSTRQLSVKELLSNPTLRGPTLLVGSIMSLQQFSGVNAVMFYSTPVLKPLLPASAGLLGIGITLVNVVMTLPAIFLVDRWGRKNLLLLSVISMGSMSALLAVGLNSHHQLLSATAIIAFITAFSVGLGPIPFLLVSELVPSSAIPALSSLSQSLSWTSNFLIALLFLPLRDALSYPSDPHDPLSAREGEGRVFYVFTGTCSLLACIVWRGLK
ncbi:hypothetical protein M231_01140 [Tremella mesenterica]|uniref:Major facilitator superfamily (MFS) profile domain-containing protein n=1 Tax=Tremella mesenterica TaxID=5217 RepID=A0A4Q1BUD9_TREME|nr:hypothetical protein M231_01140 [Tremella mesenterica]